MRMEGNARIWFTSKQKTELWERWKSGQCVADIAELRPGSAYDPKPTSVMSFHAESEGSLFNRPGWPIVSDQWGDHDSGDESEFESWIEIAHRLFVEVDDATGFERPDIVYFDDDLLVDALNQGIRGSILPAIADTAKPPTQIDLDCGCPLDWIVRLSGGGLLATLQASGSIGIVRGCYADDGDARPDCIRFLIHHHVGLEVDDFVDVLERGGLKILTLGHWSRRTGFRGVQHG